MTDVIGMEEFKRRADGWNFRGMYIEAVRLTRTHDGTCADIDIVMPPWIGAALPERSAGSETVFVFRCSQINHFSWGGYQGVDIVDALINEVAIETEWRPMGLDECLSFHITSQTWEADLTVWCSAIALIACVERPATEHGVGPPRPPADQPPPP